LHDSAAPGRTLGLLSWQSVPPQEAAGFFKLLESRLALEFPFVKIASVIGRHFPLDRDGQWDFIEKTHRLLTEGVGVPYEYVSLHIESAYKNGETDEFVSPGFLAENKKPVGRIEAGDAVVVSGKVLVGVVSAVFDSTSQFELITSSGIAVNAQVSKREATGGIVRGEHGLGLLFDLISQTEVIKLKDRIITSGLGGRFPANLLIGEVGEIRSSSSELFQKASVISATNLRNLRVVFVVKKSE